MRKGDNTGAGIQAKGGQHLVRVILMDRHAGKAICGGKGAARVDQHHIITNNLRHRDQRLGHMHGPHDNQAEGRSVAVQEEVALKAGIFAVCFTVCYAQFAGPILRVQRSDHRLTRRAVSDEIREHVKRHTLSATLPGSYIRTHRFHQHADFTTASQPRGKRILARDAKGQQLTSPIAKCLFCRDHHRAFDTAARHRPFDFAAI